MRPGSHLFVGLVEEDAVDGVRLLEVHRPLAQLQVVVLLAHGGRRRGRGGRGGGSQRGAGRGAPGESCGVLPGCGGGDREAASGCHAPTPAPRDPRPSALKPATDTLRARGSSPFREGGVPGRLPGGNGGGVAGPEARALPILARLSLAWAGPGCPSSGRFAQGWLGPGYPGSLAEGLLSPPRGAEKWRRVL